mgnify:CR=1 FL=1
METNQSKSPEKTEKKQDTRFKKGQSGNPAGRPLGSKNFETDFLSAVADIAEVNKISREEAMKILLKKAFSEAKEGNFPFWKDIHDRIYGKAIERHELTGKDGVDLFKLNKEEQDKINQLLK